MAVLSIPSTGVLTLGLELVGFSRARQNDHIANLKHFGAYFGACPETCSAIFVNSQMTQIATACIAKPQVFNLLMAMFWLKTYPNIG
jgi:uncharacterized membrane protein AbrB (regulator of aidB expression)